MLNEEETDANEPQETTEAPEVQQQQAEPPEASTPDADGATSPAETTEPAGEEVSELIQHPDGRFETRVANPIRNE